MKKIIAALAGLSLFAAAATAEGVTISAWTQGYWDVVASGTDSDGDDTIVTGMQQAWGATAPRVGITASGSTEHAGFALDIHANGTQASFPNDNAYIYVTPIEQIKLTIGKMKGDHELRKDYCYGLYDWERIGSLESANGEGFTFGDYFAIQGVKLGVYPIEGLAIVAALPLDLDGGTGSTMEDAWTKGARFGVAYTIDGIGTIKAGLDTSRTYGYTGVVVHMDETTGKIVYDKTVLDEDVMQFGVAFELTAVENLDASIGAKIPTNFENINVNAGLGYRLDALGIHALVGTLINGTDYDSVNDKLEFEDAGKFGVYVGAGVDYTLENGIGFFGDVRFSNDVWQGYNTSALDWNDSNVTFGVGVTKSLTGGVIGIAFEGSTTGNRYKNEDFAFQVPIKVSFSF